MGLDASIVLAYFAVVMFIGVRARNKGKVTAEEYFLSSRSLRWPSIAISTIATNISAGHFITMAGSAYAFGLAQANLELNAVFGIVLAAFFFVPLYLRHKVTTISQFFEMKFGPAVGLLYSGLMMLMYSLLYMGMALYTASFAIDGIFGPDVATGDPGLLGWISPHRSVRLLTLIVSLGMFSAIYTYLGGLSAVVRTDIAQFILLGIGGVIMLGIALYKTGGFSALYETGLPQGVSPGDLTPHRMHLHLPAYHDKLPWVALIGMNLLNLNYWGANQVILQRALAAKDLRNAQVGLLVGGILKYFVATIIIIPAIALAGMTQLDRPDDAYVTMVSDWLPTGVRGIILCGLFASLMSTVDSIFNSVSTLWSIDVYKRFLRKDAPDERVVQIGKMAIIGTLIAGVAFAFWIVTLRAAGGEQDPITHWFNSSTYYIKTAFVVLICSAVFLKNPSRRLVLAAMVLCTVTYFALTQLIPEANYFVRATIVIVSGFLFVAIPTVLANGWRVPIAEIVQSSSRRVTWFGVGLLSSLVLAHVVFH